MRVTRKSEKKVRFMDLKVGDTFIDDDEIFIKCRYEGENIFCPRCDEQINIDDEMPCLALMLSTGELWTFQDYSMIVKIECEVVEL